MERRDFIRGVLAAAFTMIVACAAPAQIYRPPSGTMWDPSILWHNGKYYLFSMYRPEGSKVYDSIWLATSSDGVHWQDGGVVITSKDRVDNTIYKMFVAKVGDRFIMDHGAFSGRPDYGNDTLRFWESSDLVHWKYLYETHPDKRWYDEHGRWDHMYMIPKNEDDPQAGYWGYVVANLLHGAGWGMQESPDGIKWKAIEPPAIDYGDLPQASFETGGCERLNGKYYVIGGVPGYMGNWSYSMFAFVSDGPRGPFRPIRDAFRLCGASGYPGRAGVQWLAAWARGQNELLISNYISADAANTDLWLTPLKKPVVDDKGHLRMGYWKANEAAKGEPVALMPAAAVLEYPAGAAGLSGSGGTLVLDTEMKKPGEFEDRYAVALLNGRFDLNEGVIVEGVVRARRPARLRPTYAGFYIEEKAAVGTAVLLQTGHASWRRSEIGVLALGEPPRFESLDTTGPGCATVTGLNDGQEHSFRLWIRQNMFELYVDDLLMQTFVTRGNSGRLGLVVENGRAEFGKLRIWRMR